MFGRDNKSVVAAFLVVQTVKSLPTVRETQVRSPGGGHGNPLQYSCLGNPLDREAWWDMGQGFAKSWTQPRTNTFTFSLWFYIREEEKGKTLWAIRDCVEVFRDGNDMLSEICVTLP